VIPWTIYVNSWLSALTIGFGCPEECLLPRICEPEIQLQIAFLIVLHWTGWARVILKYNSAQQSQQNRWFASIIPFTCGPHLRESVSYSRKGTDNGHVSIILRVTITSEYGTCILVCMVRERSSQTIRALYLHEVTPSSSDF
jgi:hypothetical protein